MPEPKALNSYPQEYADLFIEASSKRIEIPCETKAEAATLRAHLYAYRQAVYHTPETLPKVALVAPLIKFSVVGATLIVEPSEPLALKDRVRDALNSSDASRDPRHIRNDGAIDEAKSS